MRHINRSRVVLLLATTLTVFSLTRTSAQNTSHLVFIGTYTGAASKGIYAFRFDDRTGAFTPVGLAAETPSPSFLTASRDGRFVYAVNEMSTFQGEPSGSVTAFRVDAIKSTLTALNTVSSRGTDPCHLAIDRTGKFLAVANYSSGTFAIFPVNTDGTLSPAKSVLSNTGSGPNRDRQTGPHAHQVAFSDSNRYLLGVDLGVDRVLVYRFDATTGTATPNTPPGVVAAPGSGPRHIAFMPDGRSMFAINELLSTVVSYGWDAPRGILTTRSTAKTLPANFQGENSTAEIAVHPNGRVLYGSNRGHDSIAVFAIGPNGALTLVEHESTRGKTPRNFVIDPTGRWLIAANQDSNTLAVFSIDSGTGALAPVGPLVNVGAPVSILFAS